MYGKGIIYIAEHEIEESCYFLLIVLANFLLYTNNRTRRREENHIWYP